MGNGTGTSGSRWKMEKLKQLLGKLINMFTTFFRRPSQILIAQKGIQWTGDNKGPITPSVTGDVTVSVEFDDFTADDLFIGDDTWPNLQSGLISGSDTLTNARLPSLGDIAQWTFEDLTQDVLTLTGPGFVDLHLANCATKTLNVALDSLTGLLEIAGGTAADVLTLTMPGTVTQLTISNCAYTSLSVSLPASLTHFSVTGCVSITSLPDLTGLTALTAVDVSGSALTAIPALPDSVTSLDMHGNSGSMDTPPSLPAGLLNLNCNGCTWVDGGDGVNGVLGCLDTNGLSNGTVDLRGGGAPSDLIWHDSLVAKGWTVLIDP
jgi:hypothetical protein